MTAREEELRRGTWGGMFDFIRKQRSQRKKMLAFCACCRCTWEHSKLECNHKAIEASEQFADGEITVDVLGERWDATRFEPVVYTSWFLAAAGPADRGGSFPQLSPHGPEEEAALAAFRSLQKEHDTAWTAGWIACGIDVFGHVLNRAKFSRAWRTDTAIALARQTYESREFSAMPILADALQDAGCDNEAVLSHCRSAGPHVRGCWVVDLVLGKK